MDTSTLYIILTGTDPASEKGGIAQVMPGYMELLDLTGVKWQFMPTHNSSVWHGKWWPWFKSLLFLPGIIAHKKQQGYTPVIYSHPGASISLFRQGVFISVGRLFGSRVVIHIHTAAAITYLSSRLKRKLYLAVLSKADALFVLTHWWKTFFKEHGVQNNIFVVPNPLNERLRNIANRQTSTNSKRDKLALLVLSRLVKGKGVDIAVNAMQFVDDAQLTVAGEGEEKSSLVAWTIQYGIEDKVRFIGWVSGKEKQEVLENTDVLIHLTRYDAMPMGVLEALAFGKPVIALNWGPIPDLIPKGIAGFLVEDDPIEIAQAISKLRDPKVRERMGSAAKSWVLDNYEADIVRSQLISALEATVESKFEHSTK